MHRLHRARNIAEWRPFVPAVGIQETRMTLKADGKRVAILATNGFEELELFSPKGAIEAAGGSVEVISLEAGDIQGLRHMEKGRTIHVDKTLAEARADDYDAILISRRPLQPGQAPHRERGAAFRQLYSVNQRKPVFAICHGPQVLISAGAAKDLSHDGREVDPEGSCQCGRRCQRRGGRR